VLADIPDNVPVRYPPAPPPPPPPLGLLPPPPAPATSRYSIVGVTGRAPPSVIVIPPPDIVNPLNIAIIYLKTLLNLNWSIYILYSHRILLLLDYLLY
jgi:hypothetical protein